MFGVQKGEFVENILREKNQRQSSKNEEILRTLKRDLKKINNFFFFLINERKEIKREQISCCKG